ncbi:ADP-heptose:LPS heptosyltransferase [Vibrio xiamenensis]|uniref:ADP-heptose:LPS heptosyltransferase n=1 Tax=Vibrio xiamenensis TaxID=861298 RepID=A0A1G8F537_9VIBR|nr:glycosyltransferase family 9 protein [Vibrio xiamenensis]SDH77212.1 ADP-heptose:LPS heptosyltransferase [Vibrio xiamenensis]
MNIAVFVPSRPHFGNILTQLPFLCGLKQVHPDAKITIWTKFDTSRVLIGADAADELINYKNFGFLRLLTSLNQKKYDAIYNLYPGSDKVHFAIGLCNSKHKYGYSNSAFHNVCYQKHQKCERDLQYIANSHLSLLNSIHDTQITTDIIGNLISAESRQKPNDQVTLLPGGGAGDYKRWPIEKFIQTAEKLATPLVSQINFILGPEESKYRELIPSQINAVPVKVYDCPSVLQLIDIGHHSALSIGNDCGPAHIFQMLSIPMITLWGWKCPRTTPYGTLKEWFHSHERSWALVPNEQTKDISSITVEKVSTLAQAELLREDLPNGSSKFSHHSPVAAQTH